MKKKDFSIQEYLSLGYIYLIVLGIVTEVIHYKFININILDYSTFLDVLISPISFISSHFIPMTVFTGLIATVCLVHYYVQPKLHIKFREAKWYQKMYNVEKLDKVYQQKSHFEFIKLLLSMVFFMFLGIGFGQGYFLKSRIDTSRIKPSHTITFTSGEAKDVKIVGQNSTFLFYICKNQKEATISPIRQNIKNIIKISPEKNESIRSEE